MSRSIRKSTSSAVLSAGPIDGHGLAVKSVPIAATIWNHLPADCVFMRWVQQLRRAVREDGRHLPPSRTADRAPDPMGDEVAESVWDLVGHGIVIEHSDPEEASALLPLVAEAAGMDYWEVDHDRVVGSFDDWKQLLSEDVPTFVHLRAGAWVSDSSHDPEKLGLPKYSPDSADSMASLRSALAREMARQLDGKPVVVVVAVREVGHVALELQGAHRFERNVALPIMDDGTHGRSFIAQCTGVQFDATVLADPDKVGAVVRRHDLRTRLAFARALRRLEWQESPTRFAS